MVEPILLAAPELIWWALAQVLVYMDSDVKGSEEIPDTNPTVSVNTESNAAFNAACMIGLLSLLGLVNYVNVGSLSSLNDKITTKNCEERHTQDENVEASPEVNPTRAPKPKNEELPTGHRRGREPPLSAFGRGRHRQARHLL